MVGCFIVIYDPVVYCRAIKYFVSFFNTEVTFFLTAVTGINLVANGTGIFGHYINPFCVLCCMGGLLSIIF